MMANNHPSFTYGSSSSSWANGYNLTPQGYHSQQPSNETSDVYGISQGSHNFQPTDLPQLVLKQTSFREPESSQLSTVQRIQRPSYRVTKKRAPKAATISPQKWTSCKDRIHQLYVTEHRPLKYVRETVNQEFGLNATERQYKVQIEKWNLERNVKQEERKYIMKRVQHRKQVMGKDTGYVAVRGHRIEKQKLDRWMRQFHDYTARSPPSRTPSRVSIHTISSPRSPSPFLSCLSQQVETSSRQSDQSHNAHLLWARFCRYASESLSIASEHDIKTLLDDLQKILTCRPSKPPPQSVTFHDRQYYDQWNPDAEENFEMALHLIHTDRGFKTNRRMNVMIDPLLRWTCPKSQINKPKTKNKKGFTSWLTPYGRVDVTFSTTAHVFEGGGISKGPTAIKFAIRPMTIETPFCVEFEFNTPPLSPHLLNSVKISYHAVRPNDSEIFDTAALGTVEELRYMLTNETARLTDRDTDGRSLLAYAIEYGNVGMCKFLIENGADPDDMEPDFFRGRLMPLSFHSVSGRSIECSKVLLEGGADFSLLGTLTAHSLSVFGYLISLGGVEFVEQALNLGTPFIGPKHRLYQWGIEIPPLNAISWDYSNASRILPDMVEKAILLIKRGADITSRDNYDDTVLHTLLSCRLFHRNERKILLENEWLRWFIEVQELLMIFISAGADVYATSDFDDIPTVIAFRYGFKKIWIHTLEYCGFDAEAVIAHSEDQGTDFVPQTTKIDFEEMCRRREAGLLEFLGPEVIDWETDGWETDEEETDEEDNYEEQYQSREANTVRCVDVEDTDLDTKEEASAKDTVENPEEDMDQHMINNIEGNTGEECGVAGADRDHCTVGLHKQNPSVMEFDTSEPSMETPTQTGYEGIDERVKLDFNPEEIWRDDFMQEYMPWAVSPDNSMEWAVD